MGSAAGVLGFLDALNRGVVERGKRQQILDDEDRKRQQAKEDAELKRKEALQDVAMQLGLNTQSTPELPYVSDQLSLEPDHQNRQPTIEGVDFFDNFEGPQPGPQPNLEEAFPFKKEDGEGSAQLSPLDLTYSQLRQNITEKVQLDEKEAKEAAAAKARYEMLKFGANVGGVDLGPDADPMLQAVSDIKGDREEARASISARQLGAKRAVDPREAALTKRVNKMLLDNPELEEIVAENSDHYYTNPRGIAELSKIVSEKKHNEDIVELEEALVAEGLAIMKEAQGDLRTALAKKEISFEGDTKMLKAEAYINETDAILADIALAQASAARIGRIGGLAPGFLQTSILEAAAALPVTSEAESVEEFAKLSNLLQRISNEQRKEIFGSALTGVEVKNQIFHFPSNSMDINTIKNTLTAFDQWLRQEKAVKAKGIKQLKERSKVSGVITADSYIPFMPQGLRNDPEYIKAFRALFVQGTPVEQGGNQGTVQEAGSLFDKYEESKRSQ